MNVARLSDERICRGREFLLLGEDTQKTREAKVKKLKPDKFLKASQNYTGCHTILLVARHKREHPALTPANKAGILDLLTPEGWKAELT